MAWSGQVRVVRVGKMVFLLKLASEVDPHPCSEPWSCSTVMF